MFDTSVGTPVFPDPAGGQGAFWDTRYTFSLNSALSTPDKIISYDGKNVYVKEGAKLYFNVNRESKLWDAWGPWYTTKMKQLFAKSDKMERTEARHSDSHLKLLGQISQLRSRVTRDIVSGNALVYTSSIDGTVQTNWATTGKDFEAVYQTLAIGSTSTGSGYSQGAKDFFVDIKEDKVIEPDEFFEVKLKQFESATPAVNKYIQSVGVFVVDDTAYPKIDVSVSFSAAQQELINVVSADSMVQIYIDNLSDAVANMPSQLGNPIVKAMFTTLLKNPLANPALTIQGAMAKYIASSSSVALGKLSTLKSKQTKAKIDALILEHSLKSLTTTGSPAANLIVLNLLARRK